MTRTMFAIPAGIFLALALLLAAPFLLELNSRVLPTALLDKPAPEFDLPQIDGLPETPGLSTADLRGQPSIVNIWASWCLPCLTEHPLVTRLADEGYAVYGIDYRDEPKYAIRWLERHGNPYARIGDDTDARGSIEWGVTGVPETFVLDRDGRIRHKIVGPMTPAILRQEVLPLLRELSK